jgi:hypothetical protein
MAVASRISHLAASMTGVTAAMRRAPRRRAAAADDMARDLAVGRLAVLLSCLGTLGAAVAACTGGLLPAIEVFGLVTLLITALLARPALRRHPVRPDAARDTARHSGRPGAPS